MPPSKGEPIGGIAAFNRAVDALCLSREEIARGLGVDPTLLAEYVSGARPVPPVLLLSLVDFVKAHESRLGAAAAALYEQAMLLLTRSNERAGARAASRDGGPAARPTRGHAPS